jgi:hypothetical protein
MCLKKPIGADLNCHDFDMQVFDLKKAVGSRVESIALLLHGTYVLNVLKGEFNESRFTKE